MASVWKYSHRPGYFGKKRDEKVASLDAMFGEGNWRLVWCIDTGVAFPFEIACKLFYEMSYTLFLARNPERLEQLCGYLECYDTDLDNLASGLDYTRQEAQSTHIQDIAVRNSLKRLGRHFHATNQRGLLQIRGPETEGFWLNPGQVPFFAPELIEQPSIHPTWAKAGSVEDFWQSNKWVQKCST
jgi:hypothetical protein